MFFIQNRFYILFFLCKIPKIYLKKLKNMKITKKRMDNLYDIPKKNFTIFCLFFLRKRKPFQHILNITGGSFFYYKKNLT